MDSAETWYYANEGTSIGPVTGVQMQALVQRGVIARDTLVWPGTGGWVTADSSTLAALFTANPQVPADPSSHPVTPSTTRFKDKRVRIAVTILALTVGLYAIYDGFGDVQSGLGGVGAASNAQINFQGCLAVAADAVQCSYQNTGPVAAKLCMDVVVTCDDGRHVASSCSDQIPSGQTSTKLVNNFSPAIQPTNSCNNIQFENMRSQE